ncbi:MAG: efflux RND transporter periplasmic adaptor subunit, partial [Thermoguttaceae bacterium]
MLIVVAILAAGGYAAYRPIAAYLKARNKVYFRLAEVEEGEIISVVNSTGDIQPVLRVEVGSFVSGPIIDLPADFNDEVQKGQLLAKVDERLYKSAVARETAALKTREAEVVRVQALLRQAENEEKRANQLREKHPDFISDTELDQIVANRDSLLAQLDVANASVEQARASLENATTNLDYTNITAPTDGLVIDRKISEGQTMAAQFQTPQLFIIGVGMREHMYVYASVDEADIGLIKKAKENNSPVEFTVDAYPDDLFRGTIAEVRLNPTSTQNVVTYPVVVEAPNPDLKLLPGMTASISFQVERRDGVLKIPNAALRFFPKRENVRPEDQKLLEGGGTDETAPEETDAQSEEQGEKRSAAETFEAKRKRKKRHVWVVEGELLKAIQVETGINDSRFTELISGDLKKG